jgi:hypothetical protein
MTKIPSPFINMLRDAVGGAVAGLITGLVLGLAIQIITLLLNPMMIEDGPGVIAPFLGMGLGTIVGAILGGIAGLKNE